MGDDVPRSSPPPYSWEEVLVEGWQDAQRRGMVGPGDARRHIEHARQLAKVLEPPTRALDLGTGAGVPGLVLAAIWTESRWTLLDAARRRTDLVAALVDRLGWNDRISVVHARAEALGRDRAHRGSYDLVIARSFGPPAVTAECGGPLVRVGGLLVVTEPPGSSGERWPATELARLGLVPVRRGAGAQILRLEKPPEERFPRKPGVPARRPLF